jgi:hypothetical protein
VIWIVNASTNLSDDAQVLELVPTIRERTIRRVSSGVSAKKLAASDVPTKRSYDPIPIFLTIEIGNLRDLRGIAEEFQERNLSDSLIPQAARR